MTIQSTAVTDPFTDAIEQAQAAVTSAFLKAVDVERMNHPGLVGGSGYWIPTTVWSVC